jgi:hypothetical protein
VPAPAVLPALIAYTKVAVVKTPVAETQEEGMGWVSKGLSSYSFTVNIEHRKLIALNCAFSGRVLFTVNKSKRSKQTKCRE